MMQGLEIGLKEGFRKVLLLDTRLSNNFEFAYLHATSRPIDVVP